MQLRPQIVRPALPLLYVALLSACAYTSTYHVTSTPTGAQVLVDGTLKGSTPVEFTYSDPVNRTMVLQKEGYKELTVPLRTLSTSRASRHYTLEEAAPVSFVRTMEPSWTSVEVRDGLSQDGSWNSVMDVLVCRFDLEVLSRENGYMRTSWLYTWLGDLREDYRVRVTIKFNPERSKVDIKSEANYRQETGWVLGSDSALLQTVRTDLMGTVGRITR